MKSVLSIGLSLHLALLMPLAGCDSSGPESALAWNGRAHAVLYDSIAWRGAPIALDLRETAGGPPVPDTFAFSVVRYYAPGERESVLSFGELRATEGEADPPYIRLTIFTGGDAIVGQYTPLPGTDNWLVIDRLDYDTGEMEGRFTVTLGPTYRVEPGLPDTIGLDDGYFETVIMREWPTAEDAFEAQMPPERPN